MVKTQHNKHKKENARVSRLLIWAATLGSIVLIASLLFPFPLALSALLALPVDPQTPIFATQLAGGYSFRSSPTVADVLTGPSYPGLEIVVGSAATTAAYGSHPASVALLKSDGTKVWEHTTYTWGGTTYNIGSVTGSPTVGDLDNDGQMDIVVGMGGWYPPLTRGGIIAFEGDGRLKWYVQTADRIAPPAHAPDGIPDAVYASPSIADLDGDGKNEVVVSAWDAYLWVLDGTTGAPESGYPIDMWDTVMSSTAVADLDGDGWPDFTFGSDFGEPGIPELPPGGGVMRAMSDYPTLRYLPGWDQFISTVWTWDPIPRGQWVDQTLYASPAIADINRDGKLEIVMGSGYYFSPSTTGHWVKVWQADGTLLKTLATNGITFASPALADLNDDGYLDIVCGAIQLYDDWNPSDPSTLYAWSGNPADDFATLWTPRTIGSFREAAPHVRMFGSPVVADIDHGQPGPEILFGFQEEVVVFNGHTGEQLTYVGGGPSKPSLATYGWPESSPAVADINNDDKLEIVMTSGIFTSDWHQWVMAWHWPGAGNNAPGADLPWPMFRKDPEHSAFVPVPTLKVTPTSFGFAYQYGSGDPNPSSSFTIRNADNPDVLDYTITYSETMMSINGPTTGTLGPLASLEIPFVVSASSQITGTYSLGINVQGTSGVQPVVGSPQQVSVMLLVGDIKTSYLPIIMKNAP
jgi:hypothetical protein